MCRHKAQEYPIKLFYQVEDLKTGDKSISNKFVTGFSRLLFAEEVNNGIIGAIRMTLNPEMCSPKTRSDKLKDDRRCAELRRDATARFSLGSLLRESPSSLKLLISSICHRNL